MKLTSQEFIPDKIRTQRISQESTPVKNLNPESKQDLSLFLASYLQIVSQQPSLVNPSSLKKREQKISPEMSPNSKLQMNLCKEMCDFVLDETRDTYVSSTHYQSRPKVTIHQDVQLNHKEGDDLPESIFSMDFLQN